MADPFDDLFDGNEPLTPEQRREPKKAGLVIGPVLSPEQFAERFVDRKWQAEDYDVSFEIPDGRGGWIKQ
jgi:hypothetical protein